MDTKIFVGTSPNNYDAEIEMIYEYSLRKHCKSNLEINWMRLSNKDQDFWSNWNTKKWFTPFSGFRWSIPQFCDFKGRVIYTDVDMINFKILTKGEKKYLFKYHLEVYSKLSRFLNNNERKWLINLIK